MAAVVLNAVTRHLSVVTFHLRITEQAHYLGIELLGTLHSVLCTSWTTP